MKNEFELKQIVKEKYSQIAVLNDKSSCCGVSTIDYSVMSDDYSGKTGYVSDADLGLGCGSPTDFANIRHGDTVLDLGSGAGNDAFIASKLTGETGKVIGLDMTTEMIDRANANKSKVGISNVEFILGEIEDMPLEENSIDVILSNCVLNLVPNKEKAFSEMYRVLKSGGRFSVSDIVLIGDIPDKIKTAAEMYSGCVSGATKYDEYLRIIEKTGFNNTRIVKEKLIHLPFDLLKNYLNEEEISSYLKIGTPIKSITVYAEKR